MILGPGQFKIGPAEIDLTGNDFKAFESRFLNFVLQRAVAEQNAIGARTIDFFQAEAAGGVGLRIQIKQQDAPPNRGDTGSQIDCSRGLAHSALLIGNSNDFGRHLRTCNGKRQRVQAPLRFHWILLQRGCILRRMNLILLPHNVTLTKAIEDHIVSRITKLEHLDRFAINARVTLEHDQTKAPERQFSCSMRLSMPGPDLFAEDVENDLYAAIDLVAKKIEQQIRKRRNKYKARKHKVAARTKRTRQEAA